MTFEEQMRVIELKELNSDDQRKVFTRLVCVYFENKTGQNEEFSERKSLTNGKSHHSRAQMGKDNSIRENNLKRSLSASNLSNSINSLHSGNSTNTDYKYHKLSYVGYDHHHMNYYVVLFRCFMPLVF